MKKLLLRTGMVDTIRARAMRQRARNGRNFGTRMLSRTTITTTRPRRPRGSSQRVISMPAVVTMTSIRGIMMSGATGLTRVSTMKGTSKDTTMTPSTNIITITTRASGCTTSITKVIITAKNLRQKSNTTMTTKQENGNTTSITKVIITAKSPRQKSNTTMTTKQENGNTMTNTKLTTTAVKDRNRQLRMTTTMTTKQETMSIPKRMTTTMVIKAKSSRS